MKKQQLLLLFLSIIAQAQQSDGYWDKERITSKEIKVSAGEKIIIKSEDFPDGTTEFVYRITLLDENQKLVSDLASVLKAIPDPYYIGKGTGGAISLASAISGSDKCTYALFSDITKATDFSKTGNLKNACFAQTESVSKDAKVISIAKTNCIKTNSQNVWFGFESKNWMLQEKIMLEIVPWVDKKASKGWKVPNKKIVLDQIKTTGFAKKLINSDTFTVNVLNKIQDQYTYNEFQQLLDNEKSSLIDQIGNSILSNNKTNKSLLEAVRIDSQNYFKQKKYTQAIDLMQTAIFDIGKPTAMDCNYMGTFFLFSKQYEKALSVLKVGENLDNAELQIKLNLAHVYLFKNEFQLAKELHKKYKSQNISATQNWIEKTKSDFEDFKTAKIENKNYDKILRILEN
jgi:hypothetical protein